MNLLHRRILSIFFMIVFAISAPILIFYAAGYRYNTRLHRIEQLGLLYVTTDPNGTKLSIDGQSYDVKNELSVKGLAPGQHDITISKDGYHTWQKKLEVEEGKTSFVSNLFLLKDEEPAPRELFDSALTVEKKTPLRVIFSKPGFLFAFDRTTYDIAEIKVATATPLANLEVDDVKGLIVYQQNQLWYTADIATQSTEQILTPAKLKVSRIVPRDGTLYLLTPDQIWSWENREEEPTLLTSHILAQDIYPSSNSFWILSKDPGQKHTFLYELPSKNARPNFLLSFAYAEHIRIADVHRRFLTIQDSDAPQLYLVDAKTLVPAMVTLPDVHTWSWSPDYTELLTASDFELAVQHVEHGKTTEILTRLSTPILDADWHASRTYAFFATADGLFAIERDARDKRNVFPLIKNKPDVRLLAQSADGTELIFASMHEGSSYVIWDLPLH